MKIAALFMVFLCFLILAYAGYGVSISDVRLIIIVTAGLAFALLTLTNLKLGLYIFAFVVPFTQQISLAKYGIVRNPRTLRTGGGAPVEIGTDDILIFLLILSWLLNMLRKQKPLFPKTPFNWPLVAFFSVSVFSFIGAFTRFEEGVLLVAFLHLLKFFEYILIYYIVISTVESVEEIKRYTLMFYVVTGVIVVIHFTALLMLGEFNLMRTPVNIRFAESMYAFPSNSVLGAYYCFFLSILISLLLNVRDLRSRFFLTIAAFILAFSIWNTFSRASYLALLASFTVLALLRERRLFLVVLMFIVFIPMVMQPSVLQRITVTVTSVKPIAFEESASVRLTLWGKAFAAFLKNPVIGTGYWTSRWVIIAEAHSQYFAMLVDIGILGFLSFLWLIQRMFKNSIALMRGTDEPFLKSLGMGYMAGLTAILTSSFFNESFETFQILAPMWFMAGLITCANNFLSEKTGMPGRESG